MRRPVRQYVCYVSMYMCLNVRVRVCVSEQPLQPTPTLTPSLPHSHEARASSHHNVLRSIGPLATGQVGLVHIKSFEGFCEGCHD
jgi:hypothetical protein